MFKKWNKSSMQSTNILIAQLENTDSKSYYSPNGFYPPHRLSHFRFFRLWKAKSLNWNNLIRVTIKIFQNTKICRKQFIFQNWQITITENQAIQVWDFFWNEVYFGRPSNSRLRFLGRWSREGMYLGFKSFGQVNIWLIKFWPQIQLNPSCRPLKIPIEIKNKKKQWKILHSLNTISASPKLKTP